MAKIPTNQLRSSGLCMINKCGTPLIKKPGSKQNYEMTNADDKTETIRLNTNNGQILMVKADATRPHANLNIDDTN